MLSSTCDMDCLVFVSCDRHRVTAILTLTIHSRVKEYSFSRALLTVTHQTERLDCKMALALRTAIRRFSTTSWRSSAAASEQIGLAAGSADHG